METIELEMSESELARVQAIASREGLALETTISALLIAGMEASQGATL